METPDDRLWFRSRMEEHEAALLRYAARITGDADRARDVVQDTFLRLFRQERKAVEAHLLQWLFTVCRNRALDVRRKEGRMSTTDDLGFAALKSPDPPPGAALETRETLGRVLALLDRLPARQQEVIRLKFQNGLSYKEISGITSHSVSYVGVLIHEGMKTLRARLGALTPEA
jgi:RNA polymerase sigma-70 factor (ECF subfamily)